MYYRIAIDIGNSETEMLVNENIHRQPSVIHKLLEPLNPLEQPTEQLVHNLEDNLLVTVNSNSVRRTNATYLVGRRAANYGSRVQETNISFVNKEKLDLPLITSLSMVAAKAIKDYYKSKGSLPEQMLEVETDISSSIPASNFEPEKARFLENRFTDNNHTITLHIGEESVPVLIKVNRCKVTREGTPALYNLVESDKEILDEFNKYYDTHLKPKEFAKKNILHVDIGDGTVEYIYTVGLNPMPDVCSGEIRGVGHATQQAIKLLKRETNGYKSLNRHQYMLEILEGRQHAKEAEQFLHEAKIEQADLILDDIQTKYTEDLGGNVDVIVVYGGGSIQFKELLFEDTLEFADMVGAKLLWIPSAYAVDMNVRGLNILNEKVFFKDVVKEK